MQIDRVLALLHVWVPRKENKRKEKEKATPLGVMTGASGYRGSPRAYLCL